ncbi:IS66 family insertion sequence element accessory protein TnpA [Bacteroides nordii]|uniref:IS66 family insertion sequence element accessory protein TnpA n=1 Tax=Bacteroides nordii TaxID=291645 RepID=UPI003744657D
MWNLKEFESIYLRYESSGLKVRDFCTNEVINEAKFYYWQKKLRAFSEVSVCEFCPFPILLTQTCLIQSIPVLLFPLCFPLSTKFLSIRNYLTFKRHCYS